MRTLTNFVCQINEVLLAEIGQTADKFIENYICLVLQQLVEKIDGVREVAGRQLQTFFKYYAVAMCQFSDKDALTGLFTQQEVGETEDGAAATMLHDDGIAYLPWRQAEFVFQQI